jgi:hypothetical protein
MLDTCFDFLRFSKRHIALMNRFFVRLRVRLVWEDWTLTVTEQNLLTRWSLTKRVREADLSRGLESGAIGIGVKRLAQS